MNQKKIFKTGNKYLYLDQAEIDYIEAECGYKRIYLNGSSCLVRESMDNLQKRLDKERFLRINRSVIINKDRIKELRPDGKFYEVVLKNNKILVWGLKFKNNLRNFIINNI